MARILLVEPNRLLGQTYVTYLAHLGHDVHWRKTAQGAVQSLDEHAIDVAIVELQIAGHNGLELLYEIRSYSDWQKLPVIVHTIVPRKQIEGSLMFSQLGIQTYLYKPATSLANLKRALTQLLAQPNHV